MIARCLFVCGALLLLANGAAGDGMYQRTRDGRSLVWCNDPNRGDEPKWSGDRDSNGYASGYGTLTWYRIPRAIVTGSNIPSKVRANVLNRYVGKMVHGKLDGPVTKVDATGKVFHATFVNGIKAANPVAGRALEADQKPTERITKSSVQTVEPPAEGPVSVIAAMPHQAVVRSPSPTESARPDPVDPAVKNRIITDFKEQTQSVLSRVGDATGNFREIDRLDSVPQLPPPISESVDSLVDRARDFRAKLGYETALHECRSETETVDALAALNQSAREVAASDAAGANSRLSEFLKNNPEPMVENQKALFRYLTSMRLLCAGLEKEAEIHLQRADSFAAEGRTGDAIRECQEAYRIFPNPAIVEKIHQLQSNSLGL